MLSAVLVGLFGLVMHIQKLLFEYREKFTYATILVLGYQMFIKDIFNHQNVLQVLMSLQQLLSVLQNNLHAFESFDSEEALLAPYLWEIALVAAIVVGGTEIISWIRAIFPGSIRSWLLSDIIKYLRFIITAIAVVIVCVPVVLYQAPYPFVWFFGTFFVVRALYVLVVRFILFIFSIN